MSTEDYAQRVLSEKPDFIKNNDYIDNLYEEILREEENKNSEISSQNSLENSGTERDTLLVYQFTDLHLTMDYAEGYSND